MLYNKNIKIIWMEDSNMKELVEQFLSLCQEYQKDYNQKWKQ